jgi:hypothetical protein
MRRPAAVALGAILAVTTGPARDATAQPSKDGYLKVRVEVEARGVLKRTEKGAVLLTRYRYYDRFDDAKEVPAAEGVPPFRVELDFTRAKELRELAKVLDGKEVVVVGMSELRQVVPQPPGPGGATGFTGGMHPGGFGYYQVPGWSLQRTVLVTRLRPVGQE